MTRVQVIYLGNPNASDDGAALRVAGKVGAPDSVQAGRPGVGLLDLLDVQRPTVLVDVTQSGAQPGTIFRLALEQLVGASVSKVAVSSHGFGPSEALQMGRALGHPLPRGLFVGVEGEQFGPGQQLSPRVSAALPSFVAAIRGAIVELEGECTKAD